MRVACLSILVALPGCLFGGNPSGDPCSDDANLCDDGGELEIDETCELDDPLEFELGQGDGMFSALAPGEAPELIPGIQGGSHMMLGVGIDNPSPDHLAFEVQVMLSAEIDDEIQSLAERTVLYDGALVDYDAGRAELVDLVVVPDYWPVDGRRWISVLVTDSCGRTGNIDHAIDE